MLRKFSLIAALMGALMLPVGATLSTLSMLPTEAVAKKGGGKGHHGKGHHGKGHHGKGHHVKRGHGNKYYWHDGHRYYDRDHRWDGGWWGYGGPCWLRTPFGWIWICD